MFLDIYQKYIVANTVIAANESTGLAFKNYSGNERTLFSKYDTSGGSNAVTNLMYNVNTYYGQGVVFGNGSTPVAEDDYKLSGDLITTFTCTKTISQQIDELGCTVTGLYRITNTGTTAITISEIGMLGAFHYASSYNDRFLIERTLLDEPITIEPSGIGQVTYTVRVNYPTA